MSEIRRSNGSRLDSTIGDLKERLNELRLFDHACEINTHCDDLVSQVALAVESAVERLNQIQANLVDEINEYRRGLLDAAERGPSASPEVENLANELVALESTCSDAESPVDAMRTAEDLKGRAKALRRRMRSDAFRGGFMRLLGEVNIEPASLGTLVTSRKDTEDEMAIKHVVLSEHVARSSMLHIERKLLGRFEFTDEATMLFLTDGSLALAINYSPIFVCDPSSNETLFELSHGERDFTALAQLSSGLLASGDFNGFVDIWNLETREHVKSLDWLSRPVISLKALPDGRLVGHDNDEIYVWNPAGESFYDSANYKYHDKGDRLLIRPFGYGDDSTDLLARLVEWHRKRPRDKSYLSKHINHYCIPNSSSVFISVNLDVLASGRFAFSYVMPDVAVIQIWSPDDGQMLKQSKLPGEDFASCTLLPNGDAVLCRLDETVEIYDLEDEKPYDSFKRGDRGPLLAVQQQQSNNSLVFVHLGDSSQAGLAPRDEPGANEASCVKTLCISSDSKRFAIGNNLDKAVVWRLTLETRPSSPSNDSTPI